MLANNRSNHVKLSWLLAMVLAAVAPTRYLAAKPGESSATLPLERILEMQQRIDEAAKKTEAAPPVAAVVHRIEVSGRLLEEAAEFALRFDIQVLDGAVWSEVPLLRQDAHTHLLKLPEVAGGAFTVIDGALSFVTKTPKRYQFELTLLAEAKVEGNRRSLALQLAASSMATCKLTFDEGLFALLNERVLAQPDGVLVLPTRGGFEIGWEMKRSEVVRQALAKPEIASVIPAAYASSVSTLEGMRITRLLYRLRFAGRKPIDFVIPTEQRVERVYLNGFAVPVEMDGRRLRVAASPARAGDESATVELVLMAEEGVYHLAGDVDLSLPRASWPINEIFLDLHSPGVFNYQWKSGSLSQAETSAMPTFTYHVPLPGKRMSFHQYLVTSQAPRVSLEYAVDLEDQYFCARSSPGTSPNG